MRIEECSKMLDLGGVLDRIVMDREDDKTSKGG